MRVYQVWSDLTIRILSAVISKAAGKPAWEICREYLYKPLDINCDPWPISKCGVNYNVIEGEEQSDLSARDLAKVGLLMLHRGEWNKRQIVSEKYEKATVTPSEVNGGYGLLWWLSDRGFHGRGFGGQELNVYPDNNVVAVVQATPTPSNKSYRDICENLFHE